MVGAYPVDARDHLCVGPGALAVENPDADECDALRYTVGTAADRSGDVGAMAVAVVGGAAVDRVVSRDRPPAEVGMRKADARVNHVSSDALSRQVVGIALIQGQSTLVDAVESPGRTGLLGHGFDNPIFLDKRDALIEAQLARTRLWHADRKPEERVLVNPLDVPAMVTRQSRGDGRHSRTDASRAGSPIMQNDDVTIGHSAGRPAKFPWGLTAGLGVQDGCYLLQPWRRGGAWRQR
jgi:hypothetical protein